MCASLWPACHLHKICSTPEFLRLSASTCVCQCMVSLSSSVICHPTQALLGVCLPVYGPPVVSTMICLTGAHRLPRCYVWIQCGGTVYCCGPGSPLQERHLCLPVWPAYGIHNDMPNRSIAGRVSASVWPAYGPHNGMPDWALHTLKYLSLFHWAGRLLDGPPV